MRPAPTLGTQAGGFAAGFGLFHVGGFHMRAPVRPQALLSKWYLEWYFFASHVEVELAVNLHNAFEKFGDPGRARTCDLPLRRRLLYPAELRSWSRLALKH